MSVNHIVAFNVPEQAAASLTRAFNDLKDGCKKDGKTYIQSIKGGKNISTEKIDQGVKVVFIMEFKSTDDLAYYIDHDPVHDAFKQRVPEWKVEGVVAFDFVDGSY